MDVVDLKTKVKNKEINFFLNDGYIYCKNNKTEEIAIVGNYYCVEVSAKEIKIIDENHNVMHLNEINEKSNLIYISKNTDLALLKSLGFHLCRDGHYVKRVYLCNENDDKNFYDIDPKTRILKLTRLDGDLDDTIIKLVKAGFIR